MTPPATGIGVDERLMRRRGWLAGALGLAALLIVGRAVQLQGFQGDHWRAEAERQQQTRVPLPARRGAIYDRDGVALALTVPVLVTGALGWFNGLLVTRYRIQPIVATLVLLIAGRGGLNLTHSEPLDAFLPRYGAAHDWLEAAIRAFPPEALRRWCEDLGQPTFTGSSGRIFPRALKSSPLLRAWLGRLGGLGVALRSRHHWQGWEADGALRFATPGFATPSTRFDGRVYVLPPDEGGRHKPFFSGYRPQFHFRTTDVNGAVTLPDGVEMVMPGDTGTFAVELGKPVAIADGLPFAIREGGRTVGAGTVVSVHDGP